MKKLFSVYIPSFCLIVCLIALFLFSTSCEKEKHYPFVERITVTYVYDSDFNEDSIVVENNDIVGYFPTDTIAVIYELDTTYQYIGDDPEAFYRSKNPGTIKTTYSCGDYVDGVHYAPLTKYVEHYVRYIIW
jgi:hypothetical protein